jgi:hypothetical protein
MALDPKTKEQLKSIAIEIGKLLKFVAIGLGVAVIGLIAGLIYLLFSSDKDNSQKAVEEKPIHPIPIPTPVIEPTYSCYHAMEPKHCRQCNKCLYCNTQYNNDLLCVDCYWWYYADRGV